MNEKKDDKPIEMPSRGRPRKKYHNIDSVFNNDFMHKSMYNSSMGFDTSTEEMSLGSMCPYNTRDDSKLLEQFNKIGDVINKRSDQNVVNKIDESKKEHPFNITDDSSQINPRDIQNSHNSFIDSSINSEDNIKNINHKMRTPIFQYPQSPFQYSHPKCLFLNLKIIIRISSVNKILRILKIKDLFITNTKYHLTILILDLY